MVSTTVVYSIGRLRALKWRREGWFRKRLVLVGVFEQQFRSLLPYTDWSDAGTVEIDINPHDHHTMLQVMMAFQEMNDGLPRIAA